MGTGYGMTETSGSVAMGLGEDFIRKSASAGRILSLVDVRIEGPDGAALASGEVGEIVVRGPMVMQGYWQRPEDTAAVLSPDGWLRTGDIVHRDRGGVYRIVDRLKDIFISGGENVAPAEVERALALHPAIAEVAVVGVPDEVWGERGVAFVVRADGAALGEDEVIAHARAELAGYKVPVRVAFVEALPRSTIEKLARSRLRAAAAELMKETTHG